MTLPSSGLPCNEYSSHLKVGIKLQSGGSSDHHSAAKLIMLGLNQAQKCPRSRPNLSRPDSRAVCLHLHPNLKIKDLNWSDPDQDPSTNVTLICLYMYIIYQGESEPKLKMVPQIGPISHFFQYGSFRYLGINWQSHHSHDHGPIRLGSLLLNWYVRPSKSLFTSRE